MGVSPSKPSQDVTPARERSRSAARRPRQLADALEHLSGYVLIGVGIAMLGAAGLLADSEVVASLFAVLGAGLVVLGAFSSRVEGQVEATRDGVRAVVRALETVTYEDELSPEEQIATLDLALTEAERSGKDAIKPSDAPQLVKRAAREVRTASSVLEQKVLDSMLRKGYRSIPQEPPDVGVDLIGERDGEVVLVEVSGRHLRLQPKIARLAWYRSTFPAGGSTTRAVLVVDDGPAVAAAVREVAARNNVEIWSLEDFEAKFGAA